MIGRLRTGLSTSPAGIVDAVFASLASFAAALFAATQFSAEMLGTYSLLFVAVRLSSVVTAQGYFVPLEVHLLRSPDMRRLTALLPSRATATALLVPALIALLTIPAATLLAIESNAQLRPLALTAMVAATVWPIQDHVRRVLYLGGKAWHASLVSIASFVVVAVCSLASLNGNIAVAWIPFGSLALANLLSLLLGIAVARINITLRDQVSLPRLKALLPSGFWLVLGTVPTVVAELAATAIVISVAGSTTMGQAEAARIVAQPVMVLGAGVSLAARPRLLQSGAERHFVSGTLAARTVIGTILFGTLAYAIVTLPLPISPLPNLVPTAYGLSGLVTAYVVANAAFIAGRPLRELLVGGGLQSQLLLAEGPSAILRVIVSPLSAVLGAFAVPLSLLIASSYRVVGLHRLIVRATTRM